MQNCILRDFDTVMFPLHKLKFSFTGDSQCYECTDHTSDKKKKNVLWHYFSWFVYYILSCHPAFDYKSYYVLPHWQVWVTSSEKNWMHFEARVWEFIDTKRGESKIGSFLLIDYIWDTWMIVFFAKTFLYKSKYHGRLIRILISQGECTERSVWLL